MEEKKIIEKRDYLGHWQICSRGSRHSCCIGRRTEPLINEMLQWYSDTQLPNYKPENPKATVAVQTTSNSPLCHISVGKWCKKAGKPFGSPERKERCARLTADVAVQTVKLLNNWKDGKFKSALKVPPALYGTTSQHNCGECHTTKVPEVIR